MAVAFAVACAVGGVISGSAWSSALAADPPEKVFNLTIVGGAVPVPQRLLRVDRNDVVRWRITSDAPGELHLHAYRVQARLVAGTPAEISFKAFATGRYRIEWHGASISGAPSGAHHAPPLATLEVRPG